MISAFIGAFIETVETIIRQIQRGEKAAQAEKGFKRFVAKKSKSRAKKRKGKKRR
jgi:hypothetical protein